VKLCMDHRVAIMGWYMVGLEVRQPSPRGEHSHNASVDLVDFLLCLEVDVARLKRVRESARSKERGGIGYDGGGSRGAG
jgi:hypothetical protein